MIKYWWRILKLHFVSKARWLPRKSKTNGIKENKGREKGKNDLNVYYGWALLLYTMTKLIRLCYRNVNFAPHCPLYGISKFVQCRFHYGEEMCEWVIIYYFCIWNFQSIIKLSISLLSCVYKLNPNNKYYQKHKDFSINN